MIYGLTMLRMDDEPGCIPKKLTLQLSNGQFNIVRTISYRLCHHPITIPPAAPATTTNQGGSFQKTSITNRMIAKAKSSGARMAVVHRGSYQAASRMPTTAALIPVKAP